jgi:iron complex outermembrane recepter protein
MRACSGAKYQIMCDCLQKFERASREVSMSGIKCSQSAKNFSALKMLLLVGTTFIATSTTAAQAQTAGAQAAPGEATDSGDIVVTARRVSETLSKVPIAVSAFNAEQLTARAVLADTDLQRSFAGLTVRTGQTNNAISFSIRGQSIDLFTGSQPGVLPYTNEVQLTSSGSASFYDLESIQVLKGPQGTLFGRNATGGAVLFTTAKPKDEIGGFLTGRIGNLKLREVQGAFNIPLAGDKAMLRVAGDILARDGFQFNIYQNVSHGEQRRESGRVSLTLKPSEQLTNETVFQYTHSGGDDLQLETFSSYACGRPGVSSAAACTYSAIGLSAAGYALYQAAHPLTKNFPNGFIDQVAFQKALGPYKVNSISPSDHDATDWFITNKTSFEIADGVTIKNIFGYAKTRAFDIYDPEGNGPFFLQGQQVSLGGPADPLYSRQPTGLRVTTQNVSDELQVVGKTGGLDYIIGVYYSKNKQHFRAPVSFFEGQPLFPTTVQQNDFFNSDTSKAVYAQHNWWFPLHLGKLYQYPRS